MTERGFRPWMVVAETGALLDDFDDETSAKHAANRANEKAKELKIKEVYLVKAR